MKVVFAKRGARPTEVSVNISKISKTLSFNSGFFRKYLKNAKPKYAREGYVAEENKIVVEFCDAIDETRELLKLTYTASGNAASCVARPLLNDFDLDIDDIAGIYGQEAIEGPVKLDDTDREIFLLSIDKRTKITQ